MKPIKKVTVDFSGLAPKDLNGLVYSMPDANKDVGNALFVCSRSIEIDTLARALHSGKEVRVTKEELETIKLAINAYLSYPPIGVRAIEKHIDDLIKQLEK